MADVASQEQNFPVAGVPQKAEANAANTELASCPFDPNRDERKSASLAARHVKLERGAERIDNFGFAREILRSPKVKQDGAGADQIDVGNPEHLPVFYLDGEAHHARRAAIVKFFTPKAIQTRYLGVMQRTTDDLLARLRTSGSARLDEISFELAVSVASEIVGLTEGDGRKMARRLAIFLGCTFSNARGVERLINKTKAALFGSMFYIFDVLPAVRVRRKQRRDDIISQTLDKGYSNRAIMIECMTYATAGMVTTREFIVMVAWHLFDRPELRERFLAADEEEQSAILQEILRLEPIAAMIYRRATEDIETTSQGAVRAGTKYAVDMRAVNSDEAAVGACPYALDPDRAKRLNQNGTFLSFGDGPHRCPGWQVALNETRVFIDRLLRVPGIRLERAPDMLWNAPLLSYELRNAIVSCDRT
jgi:cytochrome P450